MDRFFDLYNDDCIEKYIVFMIDSMELIAVGDLVRVLLGVGTNVNPRATTARMEAMAVNFMLRM